MMANSLATKKNVEHNEQSDCEQLQEKHAGASAQRVAGPAASGEALTASAAAKFGFHKKQCTQKSAG